MPRSARQQLIDLIQATNIDYLLAPASPSDPLVNLGTHAGLPNAELKSGSSLTAFGLLADSAAVLLDGISGYLDINWEPEELSDNLTFFGIANLLGEDSISRIVAWFWRFEEGEHNLEMTVIKGVRGPEGQILPFGIALRILTPEEIANLLLIFSEASADSWRNLGVVVDSTITGVEPQIRSTGVLSP